MSHFDALGPRARENKHSENYIIILLKYRFVCMVRFYKNYSLNKSEFSPNELQVMIEQHFSLSSYYDDYIMDNPWYKLYPRLENPVYVNNVSVSITISQNTIISYTVVYFNVLCFVTKRG